MTDGAWQIVARTRGARESDMRVAAFLSLHDMTAAMEFDLVRVKDAVNGSSRRPDLTVQSHSAFTMSVFGHESDLTVVEVTEHVADPSVPFDSTTKTREARHCDATAVATRLDVPAIVVLAKADDPSRWEWAAALPGGSLQPAWFIFEDGHLAWTRTRVARPSMRTIDVLTGSPSPYRQAVRSFSKIPRDLSVVETWDTFMLRERVKCSVERCGMRGVFAHLDGAACVRHARQFSQSDWKVVAR